MCCTVPPKILDAWPVAPALGRSQRRAIGHSPLRVRDPSCQIVGVLAALRSLEHGPWWPPLGELIDAARRFHAGGQAETQSAQLARATGPVP